MHAATGVAHYRSLKGLSQVQLAERLKMDSTTLSKLEQGSTIPTIELINQLVEILEVPPTFLFSKNILAEARDRARAAS